MMDRRTALKLFSTGAALALASCGRPPEEVVPYVEMPERLVPGVPLRFATALALSGYARGVIVTAMEGRPIKIEGNPRHPASLGSTDVFAEAELLSLYDPDRAKVARKSGEIAAWGVFEAALQECMAQEQARRGSGLAILTGRVTSPTLLAQIGALRKLLPESRWHRYEAIDDDAARQGALLAFNQRLTAVPRFGDARVVLTLDADPIGPGSEQIRFARDLVGARKSHAASEFLRLYAVEPSWTLTGALADHRLALRPELVRNVALAVARSLGASMADAPLPPDAQNFARAAAADLKSRIGAALVVAGPRQPPEVHALCHWINGALRGPVDYITPVDPVEAGHSESLRALGEDVRSKKTETLVIIDANPVYDAPADLDFGGLTVSVPFTAHLGLYEDETAAHCTWRLPLSHPLESWSDLRAFDGTASIAQPLIRPLYDTRTAHQMIALLGGALSASPYDLVRTTWRSHAGSGDFETWWRQTLQDGVVPNTAAAKATTAEPRLPQIAPAAVDTIAGDFTLTLAPDPSVWDGRMSNNAWLQECPKPFTKEVWGNSLQLSAADGKRLKLVDGDIVRVTAARNAIEAPVILRDGQADGTIAATLGYGRTGAGAIGNAVGADLYRLRTSAEPWLVTEVVLSVTGRSQELFLTQHHFALEGEAEHLQPRLRLAELAAGHPLFTSIEANPPTLYPPHKYGTYKWAMVVDTSACIGCNACVIACQAENNVPVVGPDQVAMGRDMHWLRVDDYVIDGRPGFSPVPCMQCEHAPCEPVCPVGASIHDSEGLNVQVYNRCVGTRFCESNCPYKVRRFNFFGYADGQSYADLGANILKAVFNPNVTVRARGVMEKCTYCVQRISAARRKAEEENRAIRDGEVVTACQAACPTRAISFGDLNDPKASVHAPRHEPHSYALLGELGTRPRTTYLARVSNPNPELNA